MSLYVNDYSDTMFLSSLREVEIDMGGTIVGSVWIVA